MSPPQGVIYYQGIETLLSGSYTLTHGISPGVFAISIAPQVGKVLEQGPVTLAYGGGRIVFHDCKVDSIAVEIGEDGTETWTLFILDKRWRWKEHGQVSGHYNVWRGSKQALDAALPANAIPVDKTERTPRQLAELCLKALGETQYDLSLMPNESRMEIAWEYERPANALAKLADLVGCRVIMKLDGTITIEPLGVGRELPVTGDTLSRSITTDPPEKPDRFVFVAGRNKHQWDLELEAVGVDTDTRVKPLNKLSYAPKPFGVKDWRFCDPTFFNDVEPHNVRELVLATAFRWYRIKVPIKIPWLKEPINDLQRILPLLDSQVIYTESNGVKSPRAPSVYGLFFSGKDATELETDKLDPDLAEKPELAFNGSFTIDAEHGLVKFSEPVYRFESTDKMFDIPAPVRKEAKEVIMPATLKLRVAFYLRNPDTLAIERREYIRKSDSKKPSNLVRYIVHDDICRERYQDPKTGRAMDNAKDVEQVAKHYLDAIEREYQNPLPTKIQYAGFKAISPDGAIQQVTFNLSTSGYATTTVNRNREDAVITPTYKERRFAENLKALLAEGDKVKRVKAEDLRAGKVS